MSVHKREPNPTLVHCRNLDFQNLCVFQPRKDNLFLIYLCLICDYCPADRHRTKLTVDIKVCSCSWQHVLIFKSCLGLFLSAPCLTLVRKGFPGNRQLVLSRDVKRFQKVSLPRWMWFTNVKVMTGRGQITVKGNSRSNTDFSSPRLSHPEHTQHFTFGSPLCSTMEPLKRTSFTFLGMSEYFLLPELDKQVTINMLCNKMKTILKTVFVIFLTKKHLVWKYLTVKVNRNALKWIHQIILCSP